ncbi:hypothetical protein CFOL_v3_12764, partial [Cephalotus follicularis]
ITKQGFRLITEENTLCSKVLKAKYYQYGHFLNARICPNPSYTWRSIHAAIPILKKGLKWRIANRVLTEVWKDKWIPGVDDPIAPSVTNILSPDARMSHVIDWNLGGWNQELVRKCFSMSIAQVILYIPLTQFRSEDRIIWPNNASGTYTVKSGSCLAFDFLHGERVANPHQGKMEKL